MTLKYNPSNNYTPRSGGAFILPSLSRSPMIRDVWADNLEEEFATIRSLLKDYPYVAMDTEFPGVVAKPVGNFKTTHEFYYQSLRCNVNLLKLIQLGITLLNEKGEVPEHCSTWQFNFRFSLSNDVYAHDSIKLLTEGGIDFNYFSTYGINVEHFAALLIGSGLLLNPDVTWLAFHSGFDFGYLTRAACSEDLPEKEEDFLQIFHGLFPSVYDIKYLLRSTERSYSFGLDALADALKLRRFGTAHQAGSDSLLTGHCYFKLLRENFGGNPPVAHNGVLYALREDSASAATPATPGMNG
ncbi:CCR4-NOT transcription complex subunit 7/8, partial [Strigomonas culicis]